MAVGIFFICSYEKIKLNKTLMGGCYLWKLRSTINILQADEQCECGSQGQGVSKCASRA